MFILRIHAHQMFVVGLSIGEPWNLEQAKYRYSIIKGSLGASLDS